ncbi:hypothetical protein F4557_001121 [Actinomadura catellatispora]|uniref:Uncharacterized protein n=1 Tax=Actinomadura livida TaxID=79909 RepID=A0A7W7MVM8_9ACTN|nr:hypothetical protein [Actinomadura catellatispora]
MGETYAPQAICLPRVELIRARACSPSDRLAGGGTCYSAIRPICGWRRPRRGAAAVMAPSSSASADRPRSGGNRVLWPPGGGRPRRRRPRSRCAERAASLGATIGHRSSTRRDWCRGPNRRSIVGIPADSQSHHHTTTNRRRGTRRRGCRCRSRRAGHLRPWRRGPPPRDLGCVSGSRGCPSTGPTGRSPTGRRSRRAPPCRSRPLRWSRRRSRSRRERSPCLSCRRRTRGCTRRRTRRSPRWTAPVPSRPGRSSRAAVDSDRSPW